MPQRAVSVDQLLRKKFDVMEFEGEWKAAFGSPEKSGTWIVWGNSGNGKTRFMLQLAKYLTKFDRVTYNTLEEGARLSFQMAIEAVNMVEVKRRFTILDREPTEDLRERLRKRKSDRIIIIDSLQFAEIDKKEYRAIRDEFPNKLFIYVSHAEGKEPAGRTASSVRYDADIKIRVEGYRAFSVSRVGDMSNFFTTWPKGAQDYWGEETI